MSIWSDRDILEGLHQAEIRIDPFSTEAVQPASVDLRLGSKFRFQKSYSGKVYDVKSSDIGDFFEDELTVAEGESIIVYPQAFVLGITHEKISLSDRVVARLEGKSSLARLGISVHSTGGFIDPGNQDLNITLEMTNHSRFPVRLHVGMWIAQIAFEFTQSPAVKPYGPDRKSRYYADGGPVLSRIAENWR